MKAFERDGKFNFVDDHNVFVGFDSHQDCCEHAGWFIADSPDAPMPREIESSQPTELPGFRFDTEFFQARETLPREGDDWDTLDAGGCVVFALIAGVRPPKYLHLFNCHNGYYSHGFEATIGDQKWQEDYL